MPRVALALLLLPFASGCITLFSKTEVVRGGEALRPVSFETEEAGRVFHDAVKDGHGYVGGTHLGVPFVTFFRKSKVLSEPAKFNDAVTRCDTNQDGVITLVEARVFASRTE
jgi:hypothetical protein